MAVGQYDFVGEEASVKPAPLTPDTLATGLEQRANYPEPHFVFLASNLNAEGRPWCPDVVRSLPAARRQVAKAGGTLFQVNVGDRPTWKDTNHPLRHSLQATGTCQQEAVSLLPRDVHRTTITDKAGGRAADVLLRLMCFWTGLLCLYALAVKVVNSRA